MPSLKRKRDASTKEQSTSTDYLDVFRRNFEAQFGVVKGLKKVVGGDETKKVVVAPVKQKPGKVKYGDNKDNHGDDSEEDEDVWNGLSDSDFEDVGSEDDMRSQSDGDDDDDDGDDTADRQVDKTNITKLNRSAPEIVDHSKKYVRKPSILRPSRSEFMTSKPPRSSSSSSLTTSKQSAKSTETDDTNEAANMKNDLSLQRLLKESHLLDESTLSHSTGRSRLQATELRIQSLGGKPLSRLDNTVSKTPMNIRRGMTAKADGREVKRRKEAKDAGIVLEKQVKNKNKSREDGFVRRDRGVGAPNIGRFQKGTLVLSKDDVKSMTNVRRKAGKGGRGGRR